MPKLAIAGFIEEDSVPFTRRGGGTANPELAAIVEQLIEAADQGNRAFAFIPCEDKLQRKRYGESIRNQCKARGYNVEKQTGVGRAKVRVESSKTPGKKVLKEQNVEGLFIRVSPKDLGEEEPTPARKKRRSAA